MIVMLVGNMAIAPFPGTTDTGFTDGTRHPE
jgi:hypothetical protein